MNLFYLMAGSVCATLVPIMTIVGYVIFGIKIVVPVILIIVGMIELSRAIMQKDDAEIKKAQSSLIKKIAVGVCIYLLVTLVGLMMSLIGAPEWKGCAGCALNVTSSKNYCYVLEENCTGECKEYWEKFVDPNSNNPTEGTTPEVSKPAENNTNQEQTQ